MYEQPLKLPSGKAERDGARAGDEEGDMPPLPKYEASLAQASSALLNGSRSHASKARKQGSRRRDRRTPPSKASEAHRATATAAQTQSMLAAQLDEGSSSDEEEGGRGL